MKRVRKGNVKKLQKKLSNVKVKVKLPNNGLESNTCNNYLAYLFEKSSPKHFRR